MTVAVVVPLATDCPARLRAWEWIRSRYETEHPAWNIVTGHCAGPWIKAVAVADALNGTDADVLIVADADVWVDGFDESVQRIASGELQCVFPHRRVFRLTEAATGRVYRDGFPTERRRSDLAEADYDGKVGGGVVVLTREMYERAPLDPRFVGWGREDESWGRALLTMTRRRHHGDRVLWHLWHPPQERRNRKQGSEANELLFERYRAAAGDVDSMSALIEEGRCHNSRISSPAQ